ncbi:hypothetical protein Tco_1195390 [Tanacetum coccineum]
MAQHRYEIPVERRISKLEETLSTFIKESIRRQKESENLVWRLKKNYDKTFKEQASSIKNIESHLGRIAELIHGKGVGSPPKLYKTNPRGLAHAITTRSGLDYNPPKNPLEETSDSQNTTTESIPNKKDHKIPIILGRPFLATTHAMIDVFNKKISFEVGDETITFDIEKSMRFLPSNDDTCHSVDMVDLTILDHVQEILPSEPFDSFLFEPINHHLPTKFNNLWDDDEVEQDLTNQILHELKSDDYAKPTLFSANTFE